MKDAKGHGSDARGAHAQGVEKVGRPIPLSPKVLDVIRNNPGGFSVTPTGRQPKSGFMVSIPGHTQILDAKALRGPNRQEVIRHYAEQHADALSHPGAHIGGWTHEGEGKVYLDVSHNVRSKAAAIQKGVLHNQIAVWDVKHSKEIMTGGTGK
jgi:hypothetical protein